MNSSKYIIFAIYVTAIHAVVLDSTTIYDISEAAITFSAISGKVSAMTSIWPKTSGSDMPSHSVQ